MDTDKEDGHSSAVWVRGWAQLGSSLSTEKICTAASRE